jgi:hypothetical protein
MDNLKSNGLWHDYEFRMIVKPAIRLAGMFQSWNSNRIAIRLCDKISEIKQPIPTVNVSELFRLLRHLCPAITISEIAECIRITFSEFRTRGIFDLIEQFFPNMPMRKIVS